MQSPDIHSHEVMAVKRYFAPVGWALAMLVLILDGKTAIAGAVAGLELCLKTLIPSLFPFFVLSMMLTSSLSGSGLLLTGVLGGYPVGAANVAHAYQAGQLSREEAERMAVLCNCAGPSFVFGVLGPILGNVGIVFALWGIYLLSIVMLWLLLPKQERICGQHRPVSLQQAVSNAIRAMAGVCGWVILFRILIAILDRWILWLLPDWMRVCIFGILELSNGCLSLSRIEPGFRFILTAGFVGFGGISVFLQTAGVTEGLSLRYYFPGKLFQAGFCMLLAFLLTPGALNPVVLGFLAAVTVFSGWILRKSEKRSGNPAAVIV